MSRTLTSPHHVEVFNSIKSSFSDFHLFDYLVSDKLKQAIMDADNIELNMKTTKKVAERYFDVDSFKTPEQKLVWAQIQLIFKSCYVLILSRQESTRSTFWNDTETLLEHYPQFASVDSEELDLLLNFRNMVKATLLVVPARLNKQCILKIAGRLEGSQNEYITGGGQKPAVTRRVQIYEQEGGISAEKRPDRNRVPKTERSEAGSKRSASTFSEKKVKLIRLSSDEVSFLAKGPNSGIPQVDDDFLSALPVAAAASHIPKDSSVPFKSPTDSEVNSFEFPSQYVVQHHSDNVNIPDFTRGTSDFLSLIVPSSDAEFWKESLTCIESKQMTSSMQRNTSQCFDENVYSETYNMVTSSIPLSTATATLTIGDTTTQAITMKNPPVLSRGFSLGFYSQFLEEDMKATTTGMPGSFGSIR